jgi:hypothetical protein
MNSTRKIAVITGVLFIMATVTSLVAAAITPALTGTDYLAGIAAHPNQVAEGALLYIIAAFTSVGIAIALYPVLKERNASLALGSVAFRALEAAFYMISVVSRLSLLTLGKQYATAGTADRAWLQAIGDALVGVHDHASLLAVFAFSLGALMYYCLFFQARLIPRWLSGAGIAAIISMLAACMLALFSDKLITGYIPLAFPIFLQETVLAVWLIAKGFHPSASAARPGKAETHELLSVTETAI